MVLPLRLLQWCLQAVVASALPTTMRSGRYDDAVAACSRDNGTSLPVPQNNTENALLQSYAASQGVHNLLIGLQIRATFWHTISDTPSGVRTLPLYDQGCYLARDVISETTKASFSSVPLCTHYCRKNKFPFAAIQVMHPDDPMSDINCSCIRNFTSSARVAESDCVLPCIGLGRRCGGGNSVRVLSASSHDLYTWYGQDELEQNALCGWTMTHLGQVMLRRGACHGHHGYICGDPDGPIWSKESVTWFTAQEHCRAVNSSLLMYPHNYIWGSFKSFRWFRQGGIEADVRFTNWADGQPDWEQGRCIMMSGQDGFWRTHRCSDSMPFICSDGMVNLSANDPSPSQPNDAGGVALTAGNIVGICTGCILVSGLLVFIGYTFVRRQQRQHLREIQQPHPDIMTQLSHSPEGVYEDINDDVMTTYTNLLKTAGDVSSDPLYTIISPTGPDVSPVDEYMDMQGTNANRK